MNTLKREIAVAFSRRAQPVWFRVLKWIVLISAAVFFWGAPSFWLWVAGMAFAGLLLHFFYRWKTQG
jgi:hypothetical protein